ncbi:MAG: class I SAM-dependent methyltransferase [Desulfobaccales bacterium]|jgi:SAM-dependent methyltransferase
MKKGLGLAKLIDIRSLPAGAWEEVECIICGKQTETTLVWPDRERGDIVRCHRCDLVYRSPRRREDDQIKHFEEDWTEALPAFQLEDYRSENLRRLVDWILTWHPSPGAILDIGSSYGTLLEQFPRSWRLSGIEPSHAACQIARERLPKASIINASLGEATLADESFDVITMVDAIYYLHQPIRDLGRLRDLLKPGGLVMVEAPNFANRGRVYRWIGHHFDDTWMYFYTPATLEKILNKAGMHVGARLDLPGHQIGSPNLWPRLLTRTEFVVLKALRKLSGNRVDLGPHFVLVARPNKSNKE